MNDLPKKPYPPKIGLIAGSSEYPILLANEALKNGTEIIAIGFPEITSPKINEVLPNVHWIPFGQFEPVVKTFLGAGVKQAIFAGKVPQTMIFQSQQFDQAAKSLLNKLPNQQTDSLIGAAAKAFEVFGVIFLDARTFLESHLADNGTMSKRAPDENELKDIQYGYRIAKHIAAEDIGQTVIVKQRAVLAIEAIEGTDEAVTRASKYGGHGMIIVKVSKPRQDFRFDVPIVGMDTLEIMSRVKAGVLAVDAEKTLILKKPEFIERANELNLCVYGVSEN